MSVTNDSKEEQQQQQPIVAAWDVGTTDLVLCLLQLHGFCDNGLPRFSVLHWQLYSLDGKTFAAKCESLCKLMHSLRDVLTRARHHVIELQFRNPTMKALSHCIQCLTHSELSHNTPADLNYSVHFMGSETKFKLFKDCGIDFPSDPRAQTTPARRYRATKTNAVYLAMCLLEDNKLDEQKHWLSQQVARRRDDFADALGLAATYCVKHILCYC